LQHIGPFLYLNSQMLNYQKRPCAKLASFVRRYWYFELEDHETPFSQMSFPYGSFELICYLENPNLMRWAGTRDDFFEPTIFFAGQLTRPYTMTFNRRCRCIGVSLYPWAGNMLYNLPAGEFTNQLVPLDAIYSHSSLYERLLACCDTEAMFTCLEAYLLKQTASKQNDQLVHQLVRAINQNPCRDAVSRHLEHLSPGRRRLEQRFVAATGLSMGLFVRKTRFQKAITLLAGSNDISLTNIGLQAGYYDQPHFIHEFKAFAGIAPREFNATGLNAFMTDLIWQE